MKYILLTFLISTQCFSQNNLPIFDREVSGEVQLALKTYQLHNWLSTVTDHNQNFELWIINYDDTKYFSNCRYKLNSEIIDTIIYHKKTYYLVGINYNDSELYCKDKVYTIIDSKSNPKKCLIGIEKSRSNIIYISGDFFTHNTTDFLHEIWEADVYIYVYLSLYKYDFRKIRLVKENNSKYIFEAYSNTLSQKKQIIIDKKSRKISF